MARFGIGMGEGKSGTSDDRTLSFSHNPAGQITSRTDSNTGYAWTDFVNFDETTSYNGLNQLLSVTGQSTAPLYDGRGPYAPALAASRPGARISWINIGLMGP